MTKTGILLRFVATIAFIVLLSAPGEAQQSVEGKVVRTVLTQCVPRPEGGGCRGNLTLEATIQGKTEQTVFTVVPDTLIKSGDKPTFLPAVQGQQVVIVYSINKGEKIARSIVAQR